VKTKYRHNEEVINYLISNNISSSGKIVSMLKTKQISWDQFKEDPRRLNTISKIKSMRSN
jgi:hypothetical protein